MQKAIVYRTTYNDIGEKSQQIVPERPVLHGVNMGFSGVSYNKFNSNSILFFQHLGKAGMVENNGLKTVSDGFRCHDQCRDWEAKAI